jgi:catechol 2,3-dioxygenase-like lactoylglutathione lyase family enzyme
MPTVESNDGRLYIEFRFSDVTPALCEVNPDLIASHRVEEDPSSRGWGAFFVFGVEDFDVMLWRAKTEGYPILDGEPGKIGSRFFAIRYPGGYVIEIAEENASSQRMSES